MEFLARMIDFDFKFDFKIPSKSIYIVSLIA